MTAFLRKHWLLLSLIAAGIPVRIYRFGDVPPGFNQDEISTVYDAWSVLTAGIDRNGVHLPLFLISWGDGSQALPAYLMVPFLWLLGVTPVSMRISALVLNLTSLAVFPLLTKRIAGERASLIAAFLLAINPWHIMASRWAHEFNYLPPLALIGIALLASGLAGKKHGKMLLAIAIL